MGYVLAFVLKWTCSLINFIEPLQQGKSRTGSKAQSGSSSPCCMDRRYERTEPDPCSGLCDADVLRASQLQHLVQHVGGDRHLARLSPVRLRTEPLACTARGFWNTGLHPTRRWQRFEAASGEIGLV